MSFFESEIVCDELEELHDLQNEIYGNLFDYPKLLCLNYYIFQ
jgi:hypothetical protein